MSDLRGFSLNSATVPWLSLPDLLDAARRHGFGAVGLWRTHFDDYPLDQAVQLVRDSGLRVSSVCRAGMFTSGDPIRAREDNLVAVEQAARLGADCLVVVPGGTGTGGIERARARILDGLADLLPVAADADVRLALEPMHPMLAEARSAVTSLREANDLADALPGLAIAYDSYHLWWDSALPDETARAEGRVVCVQVADWVTPYGVDVTACRGIPGEGPIDLAGFVSAARSTGFSGHVEVEVLAEHWWARGPEVTLDAVVRGLRPLSAAERGLAGSTRC